MASESTGGGNKVLKRKSGIESGKEQKVRRSELHINPVYSGQQFKKLMFDALQKRKNVTLDNCAMVVTDPFPHCILPNFLGPRDSVEKLSSAVRNLTFKEKHNDLYKLSQSQDFKGLIDKRDIKSVRNVLCKDFHSWISEVTGCTLNEDVDISAACYSINNFLLCHNDQSENRKVAFIYYLVDKDWKKEDGGLLQLFNMRNGVPDSVVSSLVPQENLMLFFEVTPYSFHHVSEVLTDKARFTISGWYHSEIVETEQEPLVALITSPPRTHSGELSDFVNEFYLKPDNVAVLRTQFENESEMMLFSFLKEEVYEAVSKELDECEKWGAVGPPDLRSFLEIRGPDLPPLTKDLFDFLHSETFVRYLSSLVNLEFFSSEERSVARSSPSSSSSSSQGGGARFIAQVSKLIHGSYSLLSSSQANLMESSLSSILFFNCSEWDEDHGGSVSFISKTDEEEIEKEAIVDIVPVENGLSLVYHENDVSQYTRYINNRVNQRTNPYYHRFSTVFFESQNSSGGDHEKFSSQESP